MKISQCEVCFLYHLQKKLATVKHAPVFKGQQSRIANLMTNMLDQKLTYSKLTHL